MAVTPGLMVETYGKGSRSPSDVTIPPELNFGASASVAGSNAVNLESVMYTMLDEIRANERKAQQRHEDLCVRIAATMGRTGVATGGATGGVSWPVTKQASEPRSASVHSYSLASRGHRLMFNTSPPSNPEADDCTTVVSHPASYEEQSKRPEFSDRPSRASQQKRISFWSSIHRDLWLASRTELPSISDGKVLFLRGLVRYIVHHELFEYSIGFIILLNSVFIGMAISAELENWDLTVYTVMENIFLAIYITEICMRFISDGVWYSLKQPWVLFDFVLVLLGGFAQWIVEPLRSVETDGTFNAYLAQLLGPILVFRILRLLRLLRALRLVAVFTTLWRLVQGLLYSCGTMLWTCTLVTATLYVFACCAVELITKDEILREDPDVKPIIEHNFRNIPVAMLSLLQFVTCDSIHQIYWELVVKQPLFIFYFVPLLLIVAIALMNLVTAILVESSISTARVDEQLEQVQRRRHMRSLYPDLKNAFRKIDKSGDGNVSLDEIKAAATDLPEAIRPFIKDKDIVEIFELLDIDGSGEIGEREFVEGILQLTMSDIPIETFQMLRYLRNISTGVTQLQTMAPGFEPLPPVEMTHRGSAKANFAPRGRRSNPTPFVIPKEAHDGIAMEDATSFSPRRPHSEVGVFIQKEVTVESEDQTSI